MTTKASHKNKHCIEEKLILVATCNIFRNIFYKNKGETLNFDENHSYLQITNEHMHAKFIIDVEHMR